MDRGSFVADILIVDDTKQNLQLLTKILSDYGYHTRQAINGKIALKAAEKTKPDLVLLDINMPEMDGYEVLRIMKEHDTLKDVPVIFLTAMTEIEYKTKGFDLGAVDYITKPFDVKEVVARVKTHLSLQRALAKIIKQHKELEENCRALERAERARDSLMHMIVHDLRAPLTGIMGSLDVMTILNDDSFNDNTRRLLSNAQRSCNSMIEMIGSMLDLNRLESGRMPLEKAEHDIITTIQEAVDLVGELPKRISFKFDHELPVMNGYYDSTLIRRVVTNLLSNAIKFTPNEGSVRVVAQQTGEELKVSVSDTGIGIPEAMHEEIFKKYSQSELSENQRPYSSGIGLAFCKVAVEVHGGSIGVKSKVKEGSEFYFTIPQVKKETVTNTCHPE